MGWWGIPAKGGPQPNNVLRVRGGNCRRCTEKPSCTQLGGQTRTRQLPPASLLLLQDAAGTDDEATSLGAQNEALKIALEDSRRDLQAMAAQVWAGHFS